MAVANDVSSAMEQRQAEIEAVVRSNLFARAPSLSNLLKYLAAKSLAGEAVKEYTVAVEVFGRKPDFNQDDDSIVRVEANRLRKRLKQYYDSEGAEHALQITVPLGQYAVAFEERKPAADVTPELPAVGRRAPRWIWIAAAVVALAAIAAGLYAWRRQQGGAGEAHGAAQVQPLPAGMPAGDEVRIACGAAKAYTDRAGKVWSADQFFSGGSAVHSNVAHIWRTLDQGLYRSSRQGDFSYDIPLPAGAYELRLHFAETQYGPEEVADGGEGSRMVGVTANDRPLLSYFDVAAEAGGSRTAEIKVFPGVEAANDGKLHLRFFSMHGGRGMVSGIELVPGLKGRMRPVRLTARDTAYYSEDGRWWSPDGYFQGGQVWQHVGEVQDAFDPEFFDWERWGNFSYAIPVAPGKYTVTLWFAERNFGAANRERYSGPPELASGGAGSRSFDVVANGKVLLRDFDIFKEAGGENRAISRRFTGLEPNAQGKLALEFVPRKNYATVTGIEVVAEE